MSSQALLTLGAVVLLVGLGLFLSQTGTVAECQTFIGQLGRALVGEVRQRCDLANMLRILGGLAAAGGVILVLVGAVKLASARSSGE